MALEARHMVVCGIVTFTPNTVTLIHKVVGG